MMIQVREYALLTCDNSQPASMDLGIVSEATFSWLEQLQHKWRGSSQILSREGKRFLRLGNYVGYLQSPNGESIEILPKTTLEAPAEVVPLRQLLRRMLSASLGITPREANQAALQRSDQPLNEWIISEFLRHLADLVRKGLRFDYHLNEDEHSAFIRGQLNVTAQMRMPPGRGTRFHVRYAEFSPQRIENRLLRTALDWSLKMARQGQSWRQANSLSHQLEDILPICGSATQLMRQWSDGKYLFGYRAIKPWCQLILEQMNPDFQFGSHQGISLLFPMEKLYEGWVGCGLAGALHHDYQLIEQTKSQYLLEHVPVGEKSSQRWFLLKPDFLITGGQTVVLDAKWKLLDSRADDSQRKYEISQPDLYQMFAYGQKYLRGKGNMMLIYPRHQCFATPLPVFRFDEDLSLWCVPFDLETGKLVKGEWQTSFHCFPCEKAVTAHSD
ncbi:TPA: McrC family protein [Klebsiella quasipneumoniae]|uniref:McrC family protein n=1 Tax=Klebsiella quasipneumoniae TaxID=1463165 RepID=UPI0013F7DEFE|nr:McrC family protein [Klebsiella quasipneumoniae]HBR1223860.1 McrC family protein [Klebsiella quasipneumoniae subsp. similipneumoniae]MDL4568326.1 McrC family protein [Klebsiella quasipneumoniae]MDL4589310.1 McrC family protein [Klebsiella quasipneumoniae]MDL4591674.1 McrC family protein [Klebsiella quasipneumoniae]MDL4596788.1 McrC family protein [Klebsiella quasipneumoniae]